MAPRDPAALFWTADPTIAAPELQDAGSFSPPPTWLGQVIAGPGEIDAVQQDFGIQGLNMQWTLPLQTGALGGQQAQPLYDALNQLTTQSVRLTGDVTPVGDVLQASSTGLQQTIGAFIATADSVDTVLWLLYVSLVLAGLVVLLLAARMVVLRRSAELAIRRARGASLGSWPPPRPAVPRWPASPPPSSPSGSRCSSSPGRDWARARHRPSPGGRLPPCCWSRSALPPSSRHGSTGCHAAVRSAAAGRAPRSGWSPRRPRASRRWPGSSSSGSRAPRPGPE